jgi:hypothetical protein
MPYVKVTVRDGRAGRKGGHAGVTSQGWGEVLARFEKDLPPLDEGNVLVLPDGARVMVIGSEETYYADRCEQTVHVGRALDRYIKAIRSLRIGAPPNDVTELADAFEPFITAAIDRLAVENSPAGIMARQRETFARIEASFAAARPLPVPTAEELQAAQTALLGRLQAPEQSKKAAEVEDAITETPEKEALSSARRVLEHVGMAKPVIPAFLYWWLCHTMGLPLAGEVAPDQRVLYLTVLTLVIGVIAVLYR